jgi:hypothetical protein
MRIFRLPQRDQMAPFEWASTLSRAVLAAHVSLKLMDRGRFRPANDVERHRLVGLAAKAFDLEIGIKAYMINRECPICFGLGWVCENHAKLVWDERAVSAGPGCLARVKGRLTLIAA